MTHPFEDRLARSWPPCRWRDVGVLLAVSGGVDSVALLRAVVSLVGKETPLLTVANFNHQSRPEADHDAAFVENLCAQHGLLCFLGHAETDLDNDPRVGFEEAARTARYAFLLETARTAGARYIVTAHTADDQAETVLHRIVRGTGIGGLAGIPRTRELAEGVTLIRPLLHARRVDCLEYLATLSQEHRTDASNADLRFTRNRIRHELLPQLAMYNQDIHGAINRLAGLASEASAVLIALAEQLLDDQLLRNNKDGLQLNCVGLDETNPFLVREMFKAAWTRRAWPLQDMSYDKWEQLARLASAPDDQPAKLNLPGSIVATRTHTLLQLARQ